MVVKRILAGSWLIGILFTLLYFAPTNFFIAIGFVLGIMVSACATIVAVKIIIDWIEKKTS